eukprot:2047158-Pleurochrysis_carterae.AAC.1
MRVQFVASSSAGIADDVFTLHPGSFSTCYQICVEGRQNEINGQTIRQVDFKRLRLGKEKAQTVGNVSKVAVRCNSRWRQHVFELQR